MKALRDFLSEIGLPVVIDYAASFRIRNWVMRQVYRSTRGWEDCQ